MSAPEPILIECEGNDQPALLPNFAQGICPMCGRMTVLQSNGNTIRHMREDVLAMLERGDFGA